MLRTIVVFCCSLLLMLLIAWLAAPIGWEEFLFGGVGELISGMQLRPDLFTSFSGAPGPALYLLLSGFTIDPALAPSPELLAVVEPLRPLTVFVSIGLVALGSYWARERSRRHAAIAAAAIGSLLAAGILWDYHLVTLLPIAIVSWAAGGARERRLLLGAVAIASLVPLELLRSGGVFPLWWHLISIPIALCILEAARTSRLPLGRVDRSAHPPQTHAHG